MDQNEKDDKAVYELDLGSNINIIFIFFIYKIIYIKFININIYCCSNTHIFGKLKRSCRILCNFITFFSKIIWRDASFYLSTLWIFISRVS